MLCGITRKGKSRDILGVESHETKYLLCGCIMTDNVLRILSFDVLIMHLEGCAVLVKVSCTRPLLRDTYINDQSI